MVRRVVLDGAVSIRNVEAMRQTLLDSFQEADALSLDIPAEQSVDLCGVQLIESARAFARAVGKTLTLERPATAFAGVLDGAGFLTDPSDDDRRFWLHEGTA